MSTLADLIRSEPFRELLAKDKDGVVDGLYEWDRGNAGVHEWKPERTSLTSFGFERILRRLENVCGVDIAHASVLLMRGMMTLTICFDLGKASMTLHYDEVEDCITQQLLLGDEVDMEGLTASMRLLLRADPSRLLDAALPGHEAMTVRELLRRMRLTPEFNLDAKTVRIMTLTG